MQRTRLNTLVTIAAVRLERFRANPWRRTSLLIIALLSGNFVGNIIITTAGQTALWDVIAAALTLAFTESINLWVYRRNVPPGLSAINLFKAGLIYSLFVDAFKLGS